MHPVIRILCLLVVAGFLARCDWAEIGLVLALLAAVAALIRFRRWSPLLVVLRRLRFLWLSIIIAYGWFTPGQPLLPDAGAWSPTFQGLQAAGVRVAALAVLVLAVQLLMAVSSRAELVAGLRWWSRPLRLFGLDPARLALRLVLALETVPRLREAVAAERLASAGLPAWQRIGRFAGGVFAQTLEAAERAELPRVEVPESGRPAAWQWLLPASLAAALWLV